MLLHGGGRRVEGDYAKERKIATDSRVRSSHCRRRSRKFEIRACGRARLCARVSLVATRTFENRREERRRAISAGDRIETRSERARIRPGRAELPSGRSRIRATSAVNIAHVNIQADAHTSERTNDVRARTRASTHGARRLCLLLCLPQSVCVYVLRAAGTYTAFTAANLGVRNSGYRICYRRSATSVCEGEARIRDEAW